VGIALVLSLAPSSASATSVTSTGAQDLSRVDAFIEDAMRERNIPGAAIVVVRGDEILHVKGFGEADGQGRAVTPETPFRIGSSTKSFTALAVMQLVEEGKIDLEEPVQRYLPWFRLADEDASARITVANLLYQTSGIPSEANAASLADPKLSLEQNVRDLRGVAPDRPVGSSFAYSNANYDVLGLIVEEVSGQSYADYVRRNILDPSTCATASRRLRAKAAESWRRVISGSSACPAPPQTALFPDSCRPAS
jgi:CubicO group peptidase (beta-lactamase class C family)